MVVREEYLCLLEQEEGETDQVDGKGLPQQVINHPIPFFWGKGIAAE